MRKAGVGMGLLAVMLLASDWVLGGVFGSAAWSLLSDALRPLGWHGIATVAMLMSIACAIICWIAGSRAVSAHGRTMVCIAVIGALVIGVLTVALVVGAPARQRLTPKGQAPAMAVPLSRPLAEELRSALVRANLGLAESLETGNIEELKNWWTGRAHAQLMQGIAGFLGEFGRCSREVTFELEISTITRLNEGHYVVYTIESWDFCAKCGTEHVSDLVIYHQLYFLQQRAGHWVVVDSAYLLLDAEGDTY